MRRTLRPNQRACAVAERICLNACRLEYCQEQIRQRRIFTLVNDVLAVRERSTRHQDRQVRRLVRVCVTEVAPQQHHSRIEQALTIHARLSHAIQELAKLGDQCRLYHSQLRDLGDITSVVRQVVLIGLDSGHGRNDAVILNHQAGDP